MCAAVLARAVLPRRLSAALPRLQRAPHHRGAAQLARQQVVHVRSLAQGTSVRIGAHLCEPQCSSIYSTVFIVGHLLCAE